MIQFNVRNLHSIRMLLQRMTTFTRNLQKLIIFSMRCIQVHSVCFLVPMCIMVTYLWSLGYGLPYSLDQTPWLLLISPRDFVRLLLLISVPFERWLRAALRAAIQNCRNFQTTVLRNHPAGLMTSTESSRKAPYIDITLEHMVVWHGGLKTSAICIAARSAAQSAARSAARSQCSNGTEINSIWERWLFESGVY